ncbi:ATP-binding protein [Tritonibacter scottomollicae]|uniref:ATP-binding protein n=1 Tax=Tritonibacter scottomollicae TaxID=483013 RepID=UPI003AA93A4A
MTETLQFSIDATLIDRIGRELVSKQQTALVELVKNAYDADATSVDVIFAGDVLLITDDGVGMSRRELVDGFLRLATSMKVDNPKSARFQRSRAGRKGIGRFSTQRLGRTLRLKTWKKDAEKGHELRVDWDDFKQGVDLGAVTVQLEEIEPREEGTVVEISGLRDSWSDAQIRQSWRGVRLLQQPFPVAPTDAGDGSDPGFEVTFYRADDEYSDPTVVADFETEILSKMQAIVEFRVDDAGEAEWRISKNRFGAPTSWTRIHHAHREDKSPPKYGALRNAWMKAHYAILDPALFTGHEYSRIRDLLASEGGIRLYRNGFRVVPYGEQDDDWLGLDATYARRSMLAPVANRQWIGVIEVHDAEGETFEEHTSREGLIANTAFNELVSLASSVLVTAATSIAAQRGRKTQAGGSSKPTSRRLSNRLRNTARDLRNAKDDRSANEKAAAVIEEVSDTVDDIVTEQERKYAEQEAILQLLASLGMITAEFSHETGTTFQAAGSAFREALEVAKEARRNDAEFLQTAENAQFMFDRLNALTAYLNEVASARSAREIGPVSLSRALDQFKRGLVQVSERQGVTLSVDFPEFDGLYTAPMHEAELASILLNFFSNSLKAVKTVEGERRIHASGELDEDDIILRFCDNGDGINPENEDRIFDLFFTTRIAAPSHSRAIDDATGTGLGLWIVKQIVDRSEGEVSIVEAPDGFTTCFEVRIPKEEEGAT